MCLPVCECVIVCVCLSYKMALWFPVFWTCFGYQLFVLSLDFSSFRLLMKAVIPTI